MVCEQMHISYKIIHMFQSAVKICKVFNYIMVNFSFINYCEEEKCKNIFEPYVKEPYCQKIIKSKNCYLFDISRFLAYQRKDVHYLCFQWLRVKVKPGLHDELQR